VAAAATTFGLYSAARIPCQSTESNKQRSVDQGCQLSPAAKPQTSRISLPNGLKNAVFTICMMKSVVRRVPNELEVFFNENALYKFTFDI